ncbi:MAG TPA: anti-sigma factor [Vicinamibacteria bacterium]|nr:anti-sigma factor [Vicinamibacteria bacterium]
MSRPAPRRWLGWAAAAAAVVATAGLTAGYVAARYEARLGVEVREGLRTRDELRRRETALEARLADYVTAVDLLRDPATRVIELRGREPGAAARGRLVWREGKGGQLFVTGLAVPPPGQVYELWALAGPAPPRPAGLFTVDASGQAMQRVEPGEGPPVTAFVVTLAPAAGAAAPAGPTVLASR